MAGTHRDNLQPEVENFLKDKETKGWMLLEVGPWYDTQFKDLLVNKYGMVYRGVDQVKIEGRDDIDLGFMEDMSIYPDETFDFVFVCHAFEHTEQPVPAIKEMYRVLKKGGWLMIVTPQYCWHHVVGADSDHINVMTEYQSLRYFAYTIDKKYCDWDFISVFTQKNVAWKEQDYNLFSIARRKGEV